MARIKLIITTIVEDVEKLELSHTTGESDEVTVENSLAIPCKVK